MTISKTISTTLLILLLLIAATATQAKPIELAISQATYQQDNSEQVVDRKVSKEKGHTIVFFGI